MHCFLFAMVTSLQCVVRRVSDGPENWTGVYSLDLLVQACLVADRKNAPAYDVPPWARHSAGDRLSVLSTRCISVSTL